MVFLVETAPQQDVFKELLIGKKKLKIQTVFDTSSHTN